MWTAQIEFKPDMTEQVQNLCWWVACRAWLWDMQQAMMAEPTYRICFRPSPTWMHSALGVEQ